MAKEKKGVGGVQRAEPSRKGLAPKKYSFKVSGRPTGSVPSDDLTINRDGPAVALVKPDWEKGCLVFRPYPAIDPETREFLPCRNSPEEYDFTDWVRRYPAAASIGSGDKKYTFLLYSKDPNDTEQHWNNPYVVLWNALFQADKRREVPTREWARLLVGKTAGVTRPKDMYFFQGMVFERGAENYIAAGKKARGASEKDLPNIIRLTSSAGQQLIDRVNKVKRGYKGDTSDYEAMFECGDPTAMETGRFFKVWNPEAAGNAAGGGNYQDSDEQEVDLDAGSDERNAGGGGGDRKNFAKGYEVDILDVYRPCQGKKALPRFAKEEQIELIRSKIVDWDTVLWVPSVEEVCELVAKAFKNMPKLLRWGWQENPEFFTSEVNAILASRVSGPSAEVPTDEDEDEDDDIIDDSDVTEDDDTDTDEEDETPPARRTSAALETSDDDDEELLTEAAESLAEDEDEDSDDEDSDDEDEDEDSDDEEDDEDDYEEEELPEDEPLEDDEETAAETAKAKAAAEAAFARANRAKPAKPAKTDSEGKPANSAKPAKVEEKKPRKTGKK